ncbi:MAG: hypothetical protein IK125_05375 [Lachnospiraceae bacterium]|nr:hypothetical protein [Lachnospiraceae bacterium]
MKRYRFKGLLLILMCLCSGCAKKESFPSGRFEAEKTGCIILDDEEVTFSDMNPDYLKEFLALELAGLEYFRKRDEGEIMSDEEFERIRKGYIEELDVSPYINADFKHVEIEYDELSRVYDYLVWQEDETQAFYFHYYTEKGYIIFDAVSSDIKFWLQE